MKRHIFQTSWFDRLGKYFVYCPEAAKVPARISRLHETLRFIMAEENTPPKPPTPMKKTSAVPLKKETVRVTLKANPPVAAAPPAPKAAQPVKPSAPTAPPAPSAPKAPPVPTGGAPKPSAPAPTIPLKTAGAPSAPAPSGAAAKPPAPAPTVPLKTPGAPAAVGNAALPQAAASLQNTQQLGGAAAPMISSIGSIATLDDDEEEENDLIPTIFSILAFVLSIAVLALALMFWLTEKELGDLFS